MAEPVRDADLGRVEPLPCSKCGGESVRLSYCRWVHDKSFQEYLHGYGHGGEHLDAVCQRCHFKWRLPVVGEVAE